MPITQRCLQYFFIWHVRDKYTDKQPGLKASLAIKLGFTADPCFDVEQDKNKSPFQVFEMVVLE